LEQEVLLWEDMVKYYVASKFENKESVRDIYYALIEHGHIITEDWTHSVVEGEQAALDDKRGVAECDVFIGLFDIDAAYKGAYIEFGMAIALDKVIVIIGPYADRSTFIHLPGIIRYDTIAHFMKSINPSLPPDAS
jgi:hypothetical protein